MYKRQHLESSGTEAESEEEEKSETEGEEMSDSGGEEMVDNGHVWEEVLCALFQKEAEKGWKRLKGKVHRGKTKRGHKKCVRKAVANRRRFRVTKRRHIEKSVNWSFNAWKRQMSLGDTDLKELFEREARAQIHRECGLTGR